MIEIDVESVRESRLEGCPSSRKEGQNEVTGLSVRLQGRSLFIKIGMIILPVIILIDLRFDIAEYLTDFGGGKDHRDARLRLRLGELELICCVL